MSNADRMTKPDQTRPPRPLETAILDRVTNCIEHGCVICIEHTDQVQPRRSQWEPWERPRCFDGNLDAVYESLEGCRRAHGNHHIRLSIESMTWHSRLSLVVHRPH